MRSAEQLAEAQAQLWSTEFAELSAAWGTRVVLDGASLLTERSALSGAVPHGDVSAGGACRLLPCADGWVAVSLPRPSDLELVAPLIEAESSAEESWASLRAWCQRRRGTEIVDRARLLGLAVSIVEEGASALKMPPPRLPDRPASPPLVVDFSAMWAGPLCARLLRLAGARIVKVETPGRPDGARVGDPRFFELLNSGHESLVIDPQLSADSETLAELVASADIVIEASRPRALAGWGLSAENAASSGAVWISITAYGREQGDRIGFGDDVAAGAGLVDWVGGAPVFVGDALADPLTGLAAAVAALRAFGAGRLVDLAMVSVAATAAATDPAAAAAAAS